MAGNDLFLSSKALTSTYSPSPVYRRINEVAPSLREEAGFYTNPLESTLKWLSVPQQVLYTLGKNIGEEFMQRELDPKQNFFEDMQRAITGKGDLSFNTVLKSVDLDHLDLALPEEYVNVFKNNLALSIPTAFAAGVLGTIASGANPIVGITAAFSTFSFLQGKGGISSVADVVFDPLNKIRLLPKTAKGLGLSDDTFKQLQKSGRLDDFVLNGKAKVAVKGSAPAKQDLFEATVRANPEQWDKFSVNSKGMFDDATILGNGNILVNTTEEGLKTLADAGQDGLNVVKSTRIARKGEPGLMTTITMDNGDASLIGTLLNGDRKLFDFRGNSGFVITPNSPFVGKYLIPGHTSVDLAAAANILPSAGLDAAKDMLGRGILNIPGFEKGRSAIAAFERQRIAPITDLVGRTIARPFKGFLIPGAEFGLAFRKSFEEALGDTRLGGKDVIRRIGSQMGVPEAELTALTKTELLNRVEKFATGTKADEFSALSTNRQKANFEKKQLHLAVTDVLLNKVDKLDRTKVGQIIGRDALDAEGEVLKRKLNITSDDLDNLPFLSESDTLKAIDQKMTDIQKLDTFEENEAVAFLERHLDAKIDELNKIDALEKQDPVLAQRMIDEAKPSLSQSQIFDVEQLGKILEDSLVRTDESQILSKWGRSLSDMGQLLKKEIKDANANRQGLKADDTEELLTKLGKREDMLIEHEDVILRLLGKKGKLEGAPEDVLKHVELAQRALRDVLDIKSLNMKSILEYSQPEVNVYKNMLKILGVKNSKQIGVQFEAARALGKTTDSDFVVSEMAQNMSPDAMYNLVLRVSQTSNVQDASAIMGNALYQVLNPEQLQEVTRIIKRAGMSDADVNARFVTIFKRAVLNPGGILREMEKKDAGFIGKIFDGFRKVLSMVNFMKWGKFSEKETEKALFNFIQGTELNVLSKKLNGDELRATKELYDPKTGTIIDSQAEKLLRNSYNETLESMKPEGILRDVDGITGNLDHMAHHTRRLKNTVNDRAFDAKVNSANLSVSNRGTIGADQYLDLQRSVNPEFNPKMYQELLDTSVVSKNQLDDFIAIDDFTSVKSISSQASATVNRIIQYTGVLPKSAFSNEFGALLQGQEAVLRSKEMLPGIRLVQDVLAATNTGNILADKSKTFQTAMNRVSLTHTLEGGTTLQDNPTYGSLLNKILNVLETQPANELTSRLRFIKSRLRNNKNMKIADFRELQKNIRELDAVLPAEHDVLVEGNRFISNILEKEADALASQEGLIDQIIENADTAASMKETLKTRYLALSDPSVDSTLSSQIKGLLREGFDDDGVQSISEAMEAAQKNTFRAAGRKRVDNLTPGALPDEDGFNTFTTFKAKDKDNPLEEMFDGQHIPKFMVPVIQKPKEQVWEEMSTIKKTLTTLFHGATEEQAKLRTQKVNTVFQNFLNKPNMNLVGDRFEKIMQNANYDYLLNIWKGHALISPAFHVRNILSAFFVNSQHGVDSGSHLIAGEAAMFLRGDVGGIRGLTKRIVGGQGSQRYDPTKVRINEAGNVEILDSAIQGKERELYELIAKSQNAGILAGGVGEEIVQDLGMAARGDGGSLNPLSHDFKLLEINQEAAGFSEDLVRMATMHHADTVLNYNIKDAGSMTKALHFDYNLLTDFERNTMKRLLPFYTYTRKAIARDTRMFMERTGQFYRMSSMVAAMSGDSTEKQDAVSGFIKDNLGVDFRVDENGKHQYLLLGGLIPAADIVSMATSGLKTTGKLTELKPSEALRELSFQFGKQATPFLKTPLQYTYNWDFYFNKPIKRIQGEQADLFGVAVPKDVAAIVQSVRWLRDLDKVTHAAFDLKNPVNPNLPSASEREMGQAFSFLKTVGGVNVVSNDRPQDNLYFNRILPEKRERSALRGDIRRQARKGPNPNLNVAIENLKAFELQKQAEATQRAHAGTRLPIVLRR